MPTSEPPERSGKKQAGYPRNARFSELLDWHLTNGTRPNGNPALLGAKWEKAKFGASLGDSEEGRSVRNWTSKNLDKVTKPNNFIGIETLLFGENEAYNEWRQHLRAAYRNHNDVVSLDGNQSSQSATLAPVELHFPSRLPPRPQLKIFGRDKIFAELKRNLGVGTANASAPKIMVCGMAGIGKSTIVNELAYEAQLSRFFEDGILWTALGQQPRVHSELAAWGTALGLKDIGRLASSHDAAQALASFLSDKKALLIIDDIWDPIDARPFMQAAGPNCRILLTTRLTKVEQDLSANNVRSVPLPYLDDDAGLALLDHLAHDVVAANPDECRELVHNLEGLPLSLNVAGRLLKAEAKLCWGVKELLKQLADGLVILSQKPPSDVGLQSFASVAALLALTTNLLSAETLKRFASLGPFAPKPATFGLQVLQKLWRTEDPKPTIRELVSLGLLEPIGSRFQMHALLKAHARSLSAQKR